MHSSELQLVFVNHSPQIVLDRQILRLCNKFSKSSFRIRLNSQIYSIRKASSNGFAYVCGGLNTSRRKAWWWFCSNIIEISISGDSERFVFIFVSRWIYYEGWLISCEPCIEDHFTATQLLLFSVFMFNVPPTAQVIWRRGPRKSHPTIWWSRGSNLLSLLYKASGLSTTSHQLPQPYIWSILINQVALYS